MGFKRRRGDRPKRGYCKRCGGKRHLRAGGAIDQNGRHVILSWAVFGPCVDCGYQPPPKGSRRARNLTAKRRVTLPNVRAAKSIRTAAKRAGKTPGEYLADLHRSRC